VLPDWAREAMLDIKRSTDSHCDVALQSALAAFIADGHLARHTPTRQAGLCIGYGGVEVDQIATAVQALGAAMRSSRYWRGTKRGG
jgi:DNA-binding transcriptional MocR family regulator